MTLTREGTKGRPRAVGLIWEYSIDARLSVKIATEEVEGQSLLATDYPSSKRNLALKFFIN